MRYAYSLIIRVLLALAVLVVPITLFQANIFQYIFGALTLKSTYALLRLANIEAALGNYGVKHAIDIFGEYTLNIVKYCVTASAYYLYTLFVILVYEVSIWKRIEALVLGYAAIFAMNLVRILILIVMLVDKGEEYFLTAHDILGVIFSVFYVIAIWTLLSLTFHFKHLPIIGDVKILVKEMLNKHEI